MSFNREENHSHTVLQRGREVEPEASALALEEKMGNLNRDACSIARLRIAAAGTPVREIHEDLDTLADDVMRRAALDTCDESNTTRVVFMLRVVQPLGWRQPLHYLVVFHHLTTIPASAVRTSVLQRTSSAGFEKPALLT
jgi:hypothetical protein